MRRRRSSARKWFSRAPHTYYLLRSTQINHKWASIDLIFLGRSSFKRATSCALRQNMGIMTKNFGMLLLAIYLILVGITTLFHVAIGAIVMGVLALVTGILILVGK
jgi:hypothetical protein